jgi:hypothetical protein
MGSPTNSRGKLDNINAALSPSELQSDMGQPWSPLEKAQAPLEMWRYQ